MLGVCDKGASRFGVSSGVERGGSCDIVARRHFRQLMVEERMTAKLLSSFQSMDSRLSRLNARLEGVEGRFGLVSDRIRTLEERFNRVGARLDGVEGRFRVLEKNFHDLEGRVEGHLAHFRANGFDNAPRFGG